MTVKRIRDDFSSDKIMQWAFPVWSHEKYCIVASPHILIVYNDNDKTWAKIPKNLSEFIHTLEVLEAKQ